MSENRIKMIYSNADEDLSDYERLRPKLTLDIFNLFIIFQNLFFYF